MRSTHFRVPMRSTCGRRLAYHQLPFSMTSFRMGWRPPRLSAPRRLASRVGFSTGAAEARLVASRRSEPGMTANSLVRKAARVAGISFADLVDRLVRWALEDADRRSR
ncbi:MAG: hypothetical protein HY071_03190 [Chloroflexi bacterium]|nr:hypothetical protein [Chloroflexota bacterium]